MNKSILLFFVMLFSLSQAQQRLLLKVDSLFTLTEKNSKELNLSQSKIQFSKNATELEKQNANTPNVDLSFSYAKLSNAHVWDNKFNYESTINVPHTSLDLSLAASYTVFNGFAAKNKIAKSKLNEQLALLSYQKNKEDIQFLVLAKYLDLAALYNQEKVYLENIQLAEKRIRNIGKMIEQGMLTHNDLVRSQLQLTDINQKLNEVRNSETIINFDLTTILGLPSNTIIDIDPKIASLTLPSDLSQFEKERMGESNVEQKIESYNTQIAKKNIEIQKSNLYPKISLFAGDGISRPFLYSMPPIDIYMHLLQGGVKINYDLGALYKNKKNVQQLELEADISRQKEEVLKEKFDMDVHEAGIKIKNAEENYQTQQQSYQLAQDNYRVVEQKYLNKFVTITDMLDASTSLLGAQINLNNSQIAVIYQYYNFKKVAGLWHEVAKH